MDRLSEETWRKLTPANSFRFKLYVVLKKYYLKLYFLRHKLYDVLCISHILRKCN